MTEPERQGRLLALGETPQAMWSWPAAVNRREHRPKAIPSPQVDERGTSAMLMFIATEAMLFVSLFWSYYYLGHLQPSWPPHPPSCTVAVLMLAILLTSTIVLCWGEQQIKKQRRATGRGATLAAILLGCVFVGVQLKEYTNHLPMIEAATDAYASIFYTITSVHALHLLIGITMLVYVLVLPTAETHTKPAHRALHNAALYWQFVSVVWLFIVALLYIAPNVGR
jgi:heme/copper-type cytochrome/quinol oxidase subunit 3